jgi:glycosyltransferase involved in cell wall biosynthesis
MAGLLAIPRSRVSVVPLGINLDGYERRARDGAAFRVGYFARVTPEKGLHVLADAYARLRRRTPDVPMQLVAAGYLAAAHEPYLQGVRRTLESAGLGNEFSYRGTLDRSAKISFLRGLDVLSVPATYDEPKGMFLLEAMAAGVPVVQPRRGGFAEIVNQTGGGILVDPDDPEHLAEGLARLTHDAEWRETLAARAFAGVRLHYSIAKSADRLLEAYESVLGATPLRAAPVA